MTGIRNACYDVRLLDFAGNAVDGCELGDISGRWTRTLSRPSTADVLWDLNQTDGDCCDCAAREWQHTLKIDRTAAGATETVWSGPVDQTVSDTNLNLLDINAVDRSGLWQGQPYATRDITWAADTDQAYVWADIISMTEECARSGLAVTPTATGIPIGVDVTLSEGRELAPVLSQLSAVNWTVINGTLYGPGPATTNLPPIKLDANRDWDSGPIIDRDGNAAVTQWIVANAAPGEPGRKSAMYPPALATGVPCRRRLVVDQTLRDEDQLLARARQLWQLRSGDNVSLITSTDSLSAGIDLDIADLIPGRRVDVTSDGCEDLDQQFILSSVVVDFETAGTCVEETRVAVDLQPIGGSRSTRESA